MKPSTDTPLRPIDFSPLTQPVTSADIAAYEEHNKQRVLINKFSAFSTKTLMISFVGVPLLILILTLASSVQQGDYGSLLGSVLFLFVFAGVAYWVTVSVKANARMRARLYKFATHNGLTMLEGVLEPGYAGMIFDEGHSRAISIGFVFPARAEVGNYTYTTGSGKNRQTHAWGYMKVKLPRKLPHMVLDAKQNNSLGLFSNLPDTFNKEQALALEGDFNKHFTLYAPKQYERDALYVFAPDVMAKLIDNGGGFDMEVIDDKLFIYKNGGFDLGSEVGIMPLLNIVDSIASELREQTDYYADERVADRAQNIIAPQGIRLKRGINWLSVFFFVLFILFFSWPHIEAFLKR